MGWDCLAYKSYWLRDHFLLVSRSDHKTKSRNIKPQVVFRVQVMAWCALFCLIMDRFEAEVPVFARLWPVRVKVRVCFTTGAVRSAILATAGLLVLHVWTTVARKGHVCKLVFTARCTTVQSAVLLSHVVCPSVCLWRWWIMIHRLKILETNCTIN